MSAKEEQQNEAAASAENGDTAPEESNGAEPEVETTEDKPVEASKAEEPPVAESESVPEDEPEEFESPPDDLEDFLVLDEVDMSEEEGADADENELSKEADQFDGKQWDCPAHRLGPRTYTKSQLQPTEIDPRCKPDFPLAGYWPVYLGNFYQPRGKSDYNVNFAVHKYFASKGLPSFMIYRLKDTFFEEYQKRVAIFDMLVYFINKKDANRAVNWCHGDYYYGHKLKVYDGRTAMQALAAGKNSKLYRIKHTVAEDKLETETNLQHYLHRYGKVVYLSKQSLDHAIVQINHFPNRNVPIMHDPRLKAKPIKGPFRKQRFIEGDVIEQLTKEVADNPKFMRVRLPWKYLMYITHGVIPEMQMPWMNKVAKDALPPMANARPYKREVVPQKRRYDGDAAYRNGSYGEERQSRRQLVHEARQLEEQLRAVQHKINARLSVPNKPPPQQRKPLPPPMKKQNAANPEEPISKRQKTTAQIMRQRIRGARRRRGPRFDKSELDVVL